MCAGQWLPTTVCSIHICQLSSQARAWENICEKLVLWVSYPSLIIVTAHNHIIRVGRSPNNNWLLILVETVSYLTKNCAQSGSWGGGGVERLTPAIPRPYTPPATFLFRLICRSPLPDYMYLEEVYLTPPVQAPGNADALAFHWQLGLWLMVETLNDRPLIKS